ncbi:MAG: hypothetical protein PVH89_00445 [Gammaproteobacteria bacterium]|jgi:hypothetical protein
MSQIVERFEAAVQILVGEGSIKNRLRNAYADHLQDLQQVDLPIAGMAEFGELHEALHRDAAFGSVDCIKASVQKMSHAEVEWHANTIVRLYAEVLGMERGGRTEPEAIEPATDKIPPRFLSRGSR